MNIAIGSDHAGYASKEGILKYLKLDNHTITDVGTYSTDSVDYPDIAQKVATLISQKKVDRGILLCGTGIGVSIAANKFSGIRAALCNTIELAELSRRHNDANILSLGARFHTVQELIEIIKVWLNTPFEGGRHIHRINKLEIRPAK